MLSKKGKEESLVENICKVYELGVAERKVETKGG